MREHLGKLDGPLELLRAHDLRGRPSGVEVVGALPPRGASGKQDLGGDPCAIGSLQHQEGMAADLVGVRLSLDVLDHFDNQLAGGLPFQGVGRPPLPDDEGRADELAAGVRLRGPELQAARLYIYIYIYIYIHTPICIYIYMCMLRKL